MEILYLHFEPDIQIMWEEVCDYLYEIGLRRKIYLRSITLEDIPAEKRLTLAANFASARVVDGRAPILSPFTHEIEYEMKRFEGRKRPEGLLYDGLIIRKIYDEYLKIMRFSDDQYHVFFVRDLIGTKDSDGFYHARVAIFSYPSLVSIPGFSHALARDRKFYLERLLLRRAFDSSSEFNESDLTEIIKGYLLQALFFFANGWPFCEQKDCRLFNGHFLKDVIESQIIHRKLCKKHKEMLNTI